MFFFLLNLPPPYSQGNAQFIKPGKQNPHLNKGGTLFLGDWASFYKKKKLSLNMQRALFKETLFS